MNFAIIDIETTGGSPKSSKITEIAIYKHNGTDIIDEYATLVDPEMPIPPFISNLTGINDQMVQNAPKFFEIAKKIVEFTEDCVFVAHNVGFDYGIIRHEFRLLGFDYRRPHLCTVRSSRFVIPGHDSYSLGKLTRSLGIELIGRHRAGGDALATAKLFTILYQKDPTNLATFIQEEVNPKRLHPNLDIETLDELPNKTGIYKFYNDVNQLIYIGKSIHIKKRVDQHLRNSKTKKGIQMQREVSRIEYELTGSELIALLKESHLIKAHKPIYNRSLRRDLFPFGLYQYMDDSGYIRLFISQTSKMTETPLTSFNTRSEGISYLEYVVEENNLCQKLCDLYKTNTSCFQYTIKQCKGACVKDESPEDYNARCEKLINDLNFNNASFYIVDKGRERKEKSIILVEKGSLKGMGYAPFHFEQQPPHKWDRFIDITVEDRDARTILKLFLRKNDKHKIVTLD
ncbi:MAG: exonuclease domain-containing protein [Crocinitomicaceae bacterium]|nr:exonuclease domain-containing protein [Crocinitomicaceae bacterium]